MIQYFKEGRPIVGTNSLGNKARITNMDETGVDWKDYQGKTGKDFGGIKLSGANIIGHQTKQQKYWNNLARQYGFDNVADVKKFQELNGLVADGKIGSATKAAINRVNKVSHAAIDAIGEAGKDLQNRQNGITQFFSKTPERVNAYFKAMPKNMQAIINHKVSQGVTEPYIIIDKANNMMYRMQGDKILEKQEVTSGLFPGDGYNTFEYFPDPKNSEKPQPNWRGMPRTTGAGIFTVKSQPTSDYEITGGLSHEPMFQLLDNGKITGLAIHQPASKDRAALLNNGNPKDNRASYGCISPKSGTTTRWYKNKLVNDGDSVYILPEMKGNYIYQNGNGKLETYYSNQNPLVYTNSWDKIPRQFKYNRSGNETDNIFTSIGNFINKLWK